MIMTSNYVQHYIVYGPSPKAQLVKNQPANVEDTRDVGSIPGSGRSPGEGNGNLLQYSSLENPMDRGVWRAAVHGVAESKLLRMVHNWDLFEEPVCLLKVRATVGRVLSIETATLFL